MDPIILASSSPRRQEILKNLKIPFQVISPDVDESIPPNMDLLKVPEIIATRKVNGVINLLPKERHFNWILGADTLICFNNKLYGKPSDFNTAFSYIKDLQGQKHQVITSIALYDNSIKKIVTTTDVTNVFFKPMTDTEINWYLNSGEWQGAAGAYKIQGIASCFINRIEGQMSTVVGLPISNLYDILALQNYSFKD